MHDGMPYDPMQHRGQGHDYLKSHSRGVDHHSCTGLIFTACRSARIASAVLAIAIPSVCLSVCPSVRLSHAGVVSKHGT